MPNVECPECRKRYTNQGEPCPFCGYPDSPEGAQPAKPVLPPDPSMRTSVPYGYVILLLVLIGLALLWYWFQG
ncbi:MAG: hypothetical protein ACLFTB_05685 [Desulfovibrionales bacterium]